MDNLFGLNRREKYFVANSLSAVPLILIGKPILVQMRNETSVAGRLTSADGYMNLTLEYCVFIDQKGLQYPFDIFMVPERNLRHISIPDNINIKNELKNFYASLSKKKQSRFKSITGSGTFKERRNIKKHKEVLAEIYKSKN